MGRVDWKEEASCLNLDTNIFFDKYEEDEDLRRAVDNLCNACPVRRTCLLDAISRHEYGVHAAVYLENGKISREFNNHKKPADWFKVWQSLTMEVQ